MDSEQEATEGIAVRHSDWQPHSRRVALLTRGADPATQRGVEFGALNNPVVRKEDGDISFVDYTTTEQLRAYPHGPSIDKAAFVEVDHVWPGSGSLAEVIGDQPPFDYAIASHVIEHVPNVLGWLRGIHDVLRPGGILNLAIPDRRYTFDLRRHPSTLGELVEADLMRFAWPSVRQVFDHCVTAVAMPAGEPWRSDVDVDRLPVLSGGLAMRLAFDQAREVAGEGRYFDSHCWVFTPKSFLDLLRGATELGLLPFVLGEFQPTEAGEFEFFATLRRSFAEPATLDERLAAIDLHRRALDRLPDEQWVRARKVGGEADVDLKAAGRRAAAAEREANQAKAELARARDRTMALQAELQSAASRQLAALREQRETFESSTSWKITAPLRRLRGRRPS